MNIVHYTLVLLTVFSLNFAEKAEAKHASEQTRSRILKEISERTS